jgi:hypothetical protein
MEKLFIKILNRTLLVGCVLLLAGAILMAITAGSNYLEGVTPAADHSDVSVSYVPLPPVPQAASAPADTAAGQVSPADLNLMKQATPGCEAIGRIALAVSASKLDLHGAGLTTCEKAQMNAAKEFGGRAPNYMSSFTGYFDSMANDAHVATNYQNLPDDQVRAFVDNIISDFATKFRAEIAAQNSRNMDAQVSASAHRVIAVTYLGIAGTAFLAFLFIAFLIVFLRIEKHLETMSARNDAAAGSLVRVGQERTLQGRPRESLSGEPLT